MQSLKNQILRHQKNKRTSEPIKCWGLKKGDANHNAPHLAKKMWIFISLIILATLPLTAILIYEIGSEHLHAQIVESIAGPADSDLRSTPIFAARMSETGGTRTILKRLQNRMILVTSVIFLAVAVATFLFMRRVIIPIDEIGSATFKMAHGRLDEPVPVRNRNEIGRIGEFINDLAIDLQEVLLHVWNHTRQDIVLMERIAAIMSSQPGGNSLAVAIREDFYSVKQDIEDMQDLVKAFNYYHVRLDEEKVLVNEHPRVEGEYHD